jgi:hypothetical protein
MSTNFDPHMPKQHGIMRDEDPEDQGIMGDEDPEDQGIMEEEGSQDRLSSTGQSVMMKPVKPIQPIQPIQPIHPEKCESTFLPASKGCSNRVIIKPPSGVKHIFFEKKRRYACRVTCSFSGRMADYNVYVRSCDMFVGDTNEISPTLKKLVCEGLGKCARAVAMYTHSPTLASARAQYLPTFFPICDSHRAYP